MNVLDDLAKVLDELIKEAREDISEAANEQNKELANLNLKQLNEGKKATGESMPEYVDGSKSPSAPGKIRLRDKSNFQKGFYTFATPSEITFDSSDKKADILNSRRDYTPVFGLDDQRREEAQELINEQYVKDINNKLGI